MSPTDQRLLWYTLTFAIVLLLEVAADANANSISWKLSAGGTFSATSSWVGGVVPHGDDYALFGLNNGFFFIDPYTVSFTADATNFGLVVESDQVAFDLNSHVYTTTEFGAVTIGNNRKLGSLTVTDGTMSVPFQLEFAVGANVNGGRSWYRPAA